LMQIYAQKILLSGSMSVLLIIACLDRISNVNCVRHNPAAKSDTARHALTRVLMFFNIGITPIQLWRAAFRIYRKPHG
jgi:hypothetical protein